MSRLFAMGDIHGAAKALDQVLERSGFNRGEDRLIFLGDVCDGWPETRQCVDILLSIPGLVAILGNHDDWARQWMRVGWCQPVWTNQGGRATVLSYGCLESVPPSHREFFENTKHWHQEGERIFVHAGFEWWAHPMATDPEQLMWDREMWGEAQRRETFNEGPQKLTEYGAVFLGHTATIRQSDEPVKACEIWNLDQGAGYAGRLTIMDVETEEFWQSDPVQELYPGVKGR